MPTRPQHLLINYTITQKVPPQALSVTTQAERAQIITPIHCFSSRQHEFYPNKHFAIFKPRKIQKNLSIRIARKTDSEPSTPNFECKKYASVHIDGVFDACTLGVLDVYLHLNVHRLKPS